MSVSVWAPRAPTVAARLDHGDVELTRGKDGWWRLQRPYEGPYRFVLDGTAYPDPRSPCQPEGVDGPSHTLRHDDFAWTDGHWRGRPLASAVLYELHIGTFSPEGTFDGAIARLDHLVDLGVTAIELLPVATFPGRWGWGYDGVLLFAPHHGYGGPDGLKRLVNAAHGKGLAVIMDVVYNHLGPAGNHLGAFGPYFTDRHRTPWGQAINVDGPHSGEVRRFLCDNAAMWIRAYHIDGLRLDAVHAIFDESAVHILEQLTMEMEELAAVADRTVWVIAESDLNDPRVVRSRDAHGLGVHAQWSDDLHHALHVALTGEQVGYYATFSGGLTDVGLALTDVFVRAGRYSHAHGRVHGRPIGDLPRRRFVTYLQTHDQVGNRARGERIGHLVGPARQRIGAALTLLAPTVPMIFQGEEWGASAPFLYVTDHTDPELAEAVRQGRRSEFAAFGWDPNDVADPQAPESFQASVLDWQERDTAEHAEMLRFYRDLLALRASAAFLPGDRATVVQEGDSLLLVLVGRLVVAVNLGTATRRLVGLGAGDEVVVASPPVRTATGPTGPTGAISDRGGHGVDVGPDGVVVISRGHGQNADATGPVGFAESSGPGRST